MPDGAEVSFPDDMPKEQIKGLIAQKFPDVGQPSFTDKVGQAYDNRAGMAQDAVNAYQAGEQSLPETFAQVTGKGVAGFANDVIGESAEKLYDATAAPLVKEGFQAVGNAVAQSAPGQFIGGLLQKEAANYKEFAANNPRAARNLEAVGNVVELGANVVPVGKVEKGVEKVSDAVGGEKLINKMVPDPAMTADAVKAESNAAYQFATENGANLNKTFINSILDDAEKLKPQTEAGRLIAGDKATTKFIEKMQALRDKPLDLPALQEIDEELGDLIDDHTELGKLKKEGKKLHDLQTMIRNRIEDADDTMIEGGREGLSALKEGRRLWSKQAKLRDVEKIITRAEMAQQPANALKTGFKNLYLNDKRMRGYTKAEREAIKKAADTGIFAETLATFGSRLLPLGLGVKAGPLGAAAGQAISTVSRGGAAKLQVRKANNLARLIAKDGKFKVPEKFAKDAE
jgi:hypothetical protein